ncbi:hypothetical protein ALSL_1826 [Aerosticca soli]|uniref:Uncharacterized protein n=1 Tax=Aerosticca soli TaxID=2010829 RepID=A0A2Z6E5Y4_9GAMM|nr:hypothetical protein ALSL_1826 [Aerosticca soli]
MKRRAGRGDMPGSKRWALPAVPGHRPRLRRAGMAVSWNALRP